MDTNNEDEQSQYTVDDALLSLGFGKFQLLVFAYAGLAWIGEAMEIMLLSFIGPSVQLEWNLSAEKESWLTSVVFVGMLIGAYSWGVVSDNYGRRTGFLYTALVTGIAGLLSAIAPNYKLLLTSRFFVGIGLGGGPTLNTWFLEFVPPSNRGFWMAIFDIFWVIGTILEASLAWLVMPYLGWRWLLAFSALPTFLLFIFYPATPESPRYLALNGRTQEAAAVIVKMSEMNKVSLPGGSLILRHDAELDEIFEPQEGTHLVVAERKTESNSTLFNAVVKLLSPKLITTTLLLWIIFLGNAFSYYGIILLTSELSSGEKICAKKQLESTSSSSDSLYWKVFISSFAEVPGLVVSAVIVDRIGRKSSIASMLLLSFTFLLPLLFNPTETVIAITLFGARLCIAASFNIVFIYAPEVYPTSVRATGFGMASSMGRIGGILCPLVAVALVHNCHQTVAVLLFELVVFVAALAALFSPHETSGCRLQDSVGDLR